MTMTGGLLGGWAGGGAQKHLSLEERLGSIHQARGGRFGKHTSQLSAIFAELLNEGLQTRVLLKLALKAAAGGIVEFFFDVGKDQVLVVALTHGRGSSAVEPGDEARSCMGPASTSCRKAKRARNRRLLTVPTGTPKTAAMSS